MHTRHQRRLRILVVDDDLDSVQSMAVAIKDLGHDARYAISERAAIDVARRFKPNVVVLDLSLPGLGAAELATQLKSEPGLESTKLVGVTASSSEQAQQRALEAGFVQVYAKPVLPTTLQDVLGND